MKRLLTAALMTGGLATAATATPVKVDPETLDDQFEVRRIIVEMAKDVYGADAVNDTGTDLPESVLAELTPGEIPSADIEFEAAPEELAEMLPHSEPGTTWVRLGDHLVELRDDRTVVMAIYDVLP